MKQFTVYHTALGTILRTGISQDEAFDLQAIHDHEAVLEGEGDAATQRVDPETQQLVPLEQ
jgi:hypothetical protein